MTVLHSERLVLRPPVWADLAAIHDIMRRSEAMRYWSTLPHPDLETSRKWLGAAINQGPENGLENTDFFIELEGRLIGKAGAWDMPEIGFLLHPDFWRKGIIREAMQVIIPHLFAKTDVAELTADVDPRNTASLALLASLDFKETHRANNTVQLGDEWCDSIYYSLLRP